MWYKLLRNGSVRFYVNSFTLHPPNHHEMITQKVKQIKIEPVQLTNSKNEWIGFPDGYTERHFEKFKDVRELTSDKKTDDFIIGHS